MESKCALMEKLEKARDEWEKISREVFGEKIIIQKKDLLTKDDIDLKLGVATILIFVYDKKTKELEHVVDGTCNDEFLQQLDEKALEELIVAIENKTKEIENLKEKYCLVKELKKELRNVVNKWTEVSEKVRNKKKRRFREFLITKNNEDFFIDDEGVILVYNKTKKYIEYVFESSISDEHLEEADEGLLEELITAIKKKTAELKEKYL